MQDCKDGTELQHTQQDRMAWRYFVKTLVPEPGGDEHECVSELVKESCK